MRRRTEQREGEEEIETVREHRREIGRKKKRNDRAEYTAARKMRLWKLHTIGTVSERETLHTAGHRPTRQCK